MAVINDLADLERVLELMKQYSVKVFRSGDLQLLIDDSGAESGEDEDELDEKPQIGFGSTDLRGLGIATEFDEG